MYEKYIYLSGQNEQWKVETTSGASPNRRKGNRPPEEEGRSQDCHHRRQEVTIVSEKVVGMWIVLVDNCTTFFLTC